MQEHDMKKRSSVAVRRSLILTALIVTVTFFWVWTLFYTNLATPALVGIALISLLVLSIATAWTAMALPRRNQEQIK